jgi:hypothetical protein
MAAVVVGEVGNNGLSGGQLDSVVVNRCKLDLREDKDFAEADEIDEKFDCDLEVDGRADVEACRTAFASEISLFCRVLARWLFLFGPTEELSTWSWCLA